MGFFLIFVIGVIMENVVENDPFVENGENTNVVHVPHKNAYFS